MTAKRQNNPARILIVSYDEPLLLTRRMLLERNGYDVTSALGFTASVEECKKGGFHLLLLGHSIAKTDKQQMVKTFREHCPAPIVSLLRSNEPLVDGADYHIQSDPAALLELIGKILSR